uniref:Uncharacterized protein n=1 Tax=Siphoviridae sp. ctVif31 TaxID=2825532 RepID=A0A8S5Q2J3_9CAUD|nr:MAG TPA: hypothetical protein [Siphoviridae sp. ctVif31]
MLIFTDFCVEIKFLFISYLTLIFSYLMQNKKLF